MGINTKLVQELLSKAKFHNIEFMAVTKKRSVEDITELQTLGVTTFGENQVQEAYRKYLNFNKRKSIKLHLIGPLQSNKVKKALGIFDTIQSLDRKKSSTLFLKTIMKIIEPKNFIYKSILDRNLKKQELIQKIHLIFLIMQN